jgi:excisionase family DNA binding protein
MVEEARELLRISEAAKLIGVSPATLHKWAIAGTVSYFVVGPRQEKRFRRSDMVSLKRARNGQRQSEKGLLRISEAAGLLGVAPATLHRWAVAGKVPYTTTGARGERRFRREDIQALIRYREVTPPADSEPQGGKR